jgi:HEAT repeat protein
VSNDTRDPATEELIADAMSQLDGEHAWEVAAAQATLRAHAREAEPTLIDALGQGRSSIQAATLLGQLGSDAAVRPLVDAATRGDEGLRWHALMALGALPSAEALDALVVFARAEQADVRCAVAMALARRSEQRARDTLDALAQDADPEVRDTAHRATATESADRAGDR